MMVIEVYDIVINLVVCFGSSIR